MNEEKFTGKAAVYAKHRPSYPEAYLDYLCREISLGAQKNVADIGAGTGIFTRLLLERGCAVFAVEPNADMRAIAERTLGAFPNFRSVPAPAENTTLPDHSMDAVAAAQAFHWFDRQRFKEECRRILKPDAPVALAWNSRDLESAVSRENEEIVRLHCPRFKGFSCGMNSIGPRQFSDFFRDGECDFRAFRHDLTFDEEGFVGRNLSASYAPRTGDADYAPFVAALRKLFAARSENGALVLPNITQSYVGMV